MVRMQVSSNAWDLRGELTSAYLLDRLTHSRRQAGLEAHPPEDDPDSWVETAYAMLKPCDICGPDDPRCIGTWQRPWADEMLVSCLTPSLVVGILVLQQQANWLPRHCLDMAFVARMLFHLDMQSHVCDF